MIYDNYYTSVEVAKLLGITRQAVWQKMKRGNLKAVKNGRDWLYPKKQFETAMSQFRRQLKQAIKESL